MHFPKYIFPNYCSKKEKYFNHHKIYSFLLYLVKLKTFFYIVFIFTLLPLFFYLLFLKINFVWCKIFKTRSWTNSEPQSKSMMYLVKVITTIR